MNYELRITNFSKLFPLVFVIILIAMSFYYFSVTKKVFAAGEGNIGAYPTNYDPSNPKTKSWFIYELKPGETKEDSITVVNNSDQKTTAKIYAVDATTTSDGAFALLNEDQRQHEVGSWVNISTDTVTIDPRDRVDVPFTISVPKFTTVGDHAGGIIVQSAAQTKTPAQGMGLTIVSRVGTRIYETVPGAQTVSLDIQNFHYAITDNHLTFTFTLVNNGNTILSPSGTLQIRDISSKIIDTINLTNLGSIFPGKPITVTEISHITAPWFGKFSVNLTINYSPIKAIAKTISFFIYIKDWRLAVPIPIIVIAFAVFMILRKLLHHGHRIEFSLENATHVVQPLPARMDIDDEEKEKTKKTKKILPKKKSVLIATKSSYTSAPIENVDAIFISHHIKLLVLLISASILVLSLLFAFILKDFVLSNVTADAQIQSHVQSPPITQATTIPVTDTPTPTEIPIDKSQIHVTVLNGSGVTGAAKTIASKLTASGFIILKTDNASQDTTQTTIAYPNGQKDGADQLEKALTSNYTNIQEVATSDATYTITLGKQ